MGTGGYGDHSPVPKCEGPGAPRLFSKSAKNGSRQEALGTIREDWLIVLQPPDFDLSPSIRTFSAASEAAHSRKRSLLYGLKARTLHDAGQR
jgi:hypothetical protein